MELAKHCQTVKNRLKGDLIKNPEGLDDEKLAEAIRSHINRHHVAFNTLRTFAAIYLYQMARKRGISKEILNTILLFKDQVTEGEVDYSLARLITSNIIKSRLGKYLISQV